MQEWAGEIQKKKREKISLGHTKEDVKAKNEGKSKLQWCIRYSSL